MITTYMIPVSVKGIVIDNDMVWLRKNERDEWEIPGGKLEEGEQPETTVIREMEEELGYEIVVKELLQSHMYKVQKSIDESHGVFVVTYLCEIVQKVSDFEHIGEAGKAEFRQFSQNEIAELHMPDFYKESLLKAFIKENNY